MTERTHRLPSDKERKRLIKVHVATNPHYGKKPEERTIPELLSNGMINLDKPSGPTSHQVVAWVRDALEIEKTGHGGTLDPHVTGILPVALGNASRALQVLLTAGKEYVGVMHLHKPVEKERIHEACLRFVGDVYQVPPLRSAVKRVRRKRQIYYLDIIEIKDRDVLFRVGCEAGTYIRTLCVDIGRTLKTGAHMADLRRTRIGRLNEKDSMTLQDVRDAYIFWKEDKDESEIRTTIFPMENLLTHIPKIVIRDSAVDALCHGASLALPGVVEADTDIKKDDMVAVLTLKGEGVVLARATMPTEHILEKDTGICATLERVLMNKGTYPSIWKKS
ncbi:MAG: RNA-guided pseudouridylation complex pseudouridine synthase subunit Cbf5 [Euryarchaeota archaeon]|nr:RNA-guided pseudouridylation complex pseudouridine synthase subunit Cbf5 [Euryarchaeota archaeon]